MPMNIGALQGWSFDASADWGMRYGDKWVQRSARIYADEYFNEYKCLEN